MRSPSSEGVPGQPGGTTATSTGQVSEREGMRDMLIATLFFSLMSVLVKVVGDGVPSQQIVFARNLFALVATWWALRRLGMSPMGSGRPLLWLRGLFGFFGLSCFYYSITRLPLADATVLMFLNPALTAGLAVLFLRERAAPRTWMGAGLAIVGVTILTRPSFLYQGAHLPLLPVLVGLAGALFAAAGYVSVRKLRETEAPLVVVFYFPLVATPAALVTAWPGLVWPSPIEWLLLLGVGLMTQGGQVFLTRGLHKASAARATSVSYLQVVLAFAWGLMFFGEQLRTSSLLGAGVVLLGTLLASRRGKGRAVAGPRLSPATS